MITDDYCNYENQKIIEGGITVCLPHLLWVSSKTVVRDEGNGEVVASNHCSETKRRKSER